MNFLLANWRYAVITAAFFAVFSFGYYKGYQHEKARYDEHLQTDATLVAVAKAENERRLQEQTEITTNVAKEYADAVDKINAYYKSHPHIVRLCDATTSGTMSTASQSASGTNEASNGTAETTTEIDLQIASQEIAQCQALIAWELGQDEVK